MHPDDDREIEAAEARDQRFPDALSRSALPTSAAPPREHRVTPRPHAIGSSVVGLCVRQVGQQLGRLIGHGATSLKTGR